MVRGVETNTIISYHPDSTWCQTSAKRLHSLMLLVEDNVYWKKIFSKTQDPTFLILPILWYALYVWDESFELLYSHVSKMESDVLQDIHLGSTHELHVFQAHLLHYQSLLHDFRVSVIFIERTPNPAMESHYFTDEQRMTSNEFMKKECGNLLSEIDRLEKRREMLSSQLKNAMDLAFTIVNLEDSRQMRTLTQATVSSSASMVSYGTIVAMVFLPASFMASVFGMNVKEINAGSLETLAHYVEATVALTLATFYVVITLRRSRVHSPQDTLLKRAAWPIIFPYRVIQQNMSGFPKREAFTW